MGVLEQISQMRNQGVGDEEIVRTLQEQGVSPKAIGDALSQAQIKQAVVDEYTPSESPQIQQTYAPRTQEMNGFQQQAPQQEYYPQQGYEEYSQGGMMDTSMIIELAEQVFSEKIQKLQKQVKEISEFKVLSESKLDSISERLKRIENMIDKLQVEILEKIGSYGRNLEATKKEMDMMQESFAKVIPSLVGKHHQPHHETTHHKPHHQETTHPQHSSHEEHHKGKRHKR